MTLKMTYRYNPGMIYAQAGDRIYIEKTPRWVDMINNFSLRLDVLTRHRWCWFFFKTEDWASSKSTRLEIPFGDREAFERFMGWYDESGEEED